MDPIEQREIDKLLKLLEIPEVQNKVKWAMTEALKNEMKNVPGTGDGNVQWKENQKEDKSNGER